MDNLFGFVVRVTRHDGGDHWLGQRVYRSQASAHFVKHDVIVHDSRRYARVYVVPATEEQLAKALSVVD